MWSRAGQNINQSLFSARAESHRIAGESYARKTENWGSATTAVPFVGTGITAPVYNGVANTDRTSAQNYANNTYANNTMQNEMSTAKTVEGSQFSYRTDMETATKQQLATNVAAINAGAGTAAGGANRGAAISQSGNLGSIDVSKFHHPENQGRRNINWDHLRHVVHASTQFLDNVIDTCTWPLPQIENTVKRTRPVGLGIMGFADLCLKLSITYGSDESCALMDELMGFVRREAWNRSLELGADKGTFPEFENNRAAYQNFIYDTIGISTDIPLTPRNYETTTCAPTGTISLVAETSSGVEPNFSWAYVRKDTIGTRTYVHPLAAQALGIHVDQTNQASIERAAAYVVEHLNELPPHFVSAMDINSKQHVQVLAATQRNVDNAVSKTCNGASDDTIESVSELYMLARQLGCKAVSYYRDGSRDEQVLTSLKNENQPQEPIADPIPPPFELPDTAPVLDAAPDREDRLKELSGSTWQIEFDGQKLYVTVNHNGKHIQEIFVTGPISSSVGKLASKMLRGGFHVKEVAHMLDTTSGTHSVWFNQRLLTSPEQAVAECMLIMQRRLVGEMDSARANKAGSTIVRKPSSMHNMIGKCVECGGQVEFSSGCYVCRECGRSRC